MRRNPVFVVTLMVSLLVSNQLGAAELSAGVASTDLTPPPEMKATLGGYGERMNRPAEGVHDSIFAKALVVSDGKRRFALLTADILGFPPAFKPELIKRLANENWESDEIMLLPSHSHASIDMSAINPKNVFGNKQIGLFDEKLFEWTLQHCATVINLAADRLEPIELGTAVKSIEGWNRNRRYRDGPTDDALTITRVDALDGKPLAVLVNFAAHPTFLGAEHMLFSGGWPGQLQRRLERMVGDDVVVMYYNGAQGDQAPVGRPNSNADRYKAAQQYGDDLASEAYDLWSTVKTNRESHLGFHTEEFELPERSWHPDFMKTGGEEYAMSEELLKKMLPLMFPDKSSSTSLQLGDLMIVGIPGEMAAELGLEIKKQAAELTDTRYVAIGGLADQWISYILPADQYERGGYEASVSFYGSGLGNCVVRAAVDGVAELAK